MATKINRALKVSLNQKDSEFLKEIANELGISETEVLRKGLRLMLLYAKSKESEDTNLVLENNGKKTELMII